MNKGDQSQKGLFLLEVIIAVGVMLMFAHAFFTIITASYQILSQSRSETVARALANEKLEIIRNLPYDEVGTNGGIPSGSIAQQEDVSRNGQTYTVNTSITYKDDPFDNLAPTDLLPADYKIAKVEVVWSSTFPTNKSITLVTNIAPKGVESSAGGGTIRVLVFDSQGTPVPQADVHITAPTLSPAVDLNLTTDNYGNLVLPGAEICTACYNITVGKADYSTDRTYSTSEVANPDQPPVTVLDGDVSQISFAIDRISTINFQSVSGRATNYLALGNVEFHLMGSKTIGTDTSGDPVYKHSQGYTTDSNGELSIDLEWDSYTLRINDALYNLAGSTPFSPISINAGENSEVKFISVSSEDHNLLAQVQDASGSAIASASAKLSDGGSYEEIIFTAESNNPDYGQAFFSPLNEINYTLEVSHSNYQTSTSSVDVSGSTKQIIILNPN